MKTYDTILFGNGLTKALFFNFNKNIKIQDFDNFFYSFLYENEEFKKSFFKILDSNLYSNYYILPDTILEVEKLLVDNIEKIIANGFEVFAGQLSLDNEPLIKDANIYYHSLFNYWWDKHKKYFNEPHCLNIIKNCCERFKKLGIQNFYTINFDKYLRE